MICRLLFITLLAFALLPSLTAAQSSSGPAVGSHIDDFSLTDQNGKLQKLSVLLSKGPVALVVFRSAGWCSLCIDQLDHLQQDLDSIKTSGLNVVGLSYDASDVLMDFANLNGIQFPLLADPESKVIKQLGVVNTTRKKGTIRYQVAYPLTIIINRDSTVAGVVRGEEKELHNAQQLINAWVAVKPESEKEEKQTSFISISGNKFVDGRGERIVFKGMAIGDPDKIVRDGHWNKDHFQKVKNWGANVVRIPVHPPRLRRRGVENYLKLLDQAVQWCGELEMYVIIDWHSIGNLRTEKFEAEKYRTTLEETIRFWDTVSKRFAGNPTVAFYEIFNEPTRYNGKLGKCTWPQWKKIVENLIDVIYANDKNVIPLVGGFDWAYDLREVKTDPIDRPNVAYVAHPYPGKCDPPREPDWEKHFGFLADRYPIFATEMGYSLGGKYKYMIDDDGTYRNAILKYLKKKDISWCAWVFDPDWSPGLIKSYRYEPTHPGKFFKKAMLGN